MPSRAPITLRGRALGSSPGRCYSSSWKDTQMSVREAPISRGLVDELLPWLRAAVGLVFVGYSANSTIFIGARDLLWLFEPTQQITIGAWPDAFWYSSFAALILFAGEVATSERYKRTYWLFLVPDAVYT